MVEPASGTLTTVGPAWTTRSAFRGRAKATLVAAVKTSKRVNEGFMDVKRAANMPALRIPHDPRGEMVVKKSRQVVVRNARHL